MKDGFMKRYFLSSFEKCQFYDFLPEFFLHFCTAKTGTGTKIATCTSPLTDIFGQDMAEINFSVCNL